jgi:hypothetical protein
MPTPQTQNNPVGNMEPTRIAQLSGMIQANVERIDAWYKEKGIPSPSFDIDYPDDLPAEIHEARTAVLIATDELTDLMLGARNIAECQPPQVVCIHSVHQYRH